MHSSQEPDYLRLFRNQPLSNQTPWQPLYFTAIFKASLATTLLTKTFLSNQTQGQPQSSINQPHLQQHTSATVLLGNRIPEQQLP